MKVGEHATQFVKINPFMRALMVFFVPAYVSFVAIIAVQNQTVGSELVIPCLLLLCVVNFLPLIFYRDQYGWFHPLIFSLAFFVLDLFRSFPVYAYGLQQNSGLLGYGLEDLAHLVAIATLYTVLGRIAYYIGFSLKSPVATPELHFKEPSLIPIKSILVIILSLFAFNSYIGRQGGLVAHLLFLAKGRTNLINEGLLSGEWIIITRFSALACLVWLASDPKSVRKPIFWISVVLSLIPQYLVAGSRSNLLFFFLVGLIAYMMINQKISIQSSIIGVLLVLIVLGSLGNFRKSTWSGKVDWNVIYELGPTSALARSVNEMQLRSSDYSPIYPIIARVPKEIDYLYGRSYLSLLATPIPRAVWPGKPRTTGAIVGELFLNTDAQIPVGAVEEAYWNFSIPGIFLVFLVYGMFHKWLYRLVVHYQHVNSMRLLYVITLFYLTPSVINIVTWAQILLSTIVLLILFGVMRLRIGGSKSKELVSVPV